MLLAYDTGQAYKDFNMRNIVIRRQDDGKGFLLGVEFVKDQKTKDSFDSEDGYLANLIAKRAFENGLIIYPGGGTVDGHKGDHILVAPPFIIRKEQIDEMISILNQSTTEVEVEVF